MVGGSSSDVCIASTHLREMQGRQILRSPNFATDMLTVTDGSQVH